MQWLLGLVIDRFFKALLAWITKLWADNQAAKKRNQEIDDRTKGQADAVKKAESEDEMEQAARDILNRNS